MNYFEDWYSQPNDENDELEKDQERLLTTLLTAAAADFPSGGLQNDPRVNSTFTSEPAEFINRIVADNHIPHLTNRYPADINLGLGDQEDLPTRDRSVYNFLRKPEEPLGDLGFFDRNVQENSTSNLTGSSGLDDFFWGGLRNESNLEAQLPRADRLFNSGPIPGSQAGDTTNQWNSPAEAGKDSDTKDATITLKKYSREFNVTYSDPSQADVLKKWLNDRVNADAWIKWYDSLNPKPTGATVNLKMVPTDTEGSQEWFPTSGWVIRWYLLKLVVKLNSNSIRRRIWKT